LISCFSASVILEYFDDGAVFSMQSLMIRVGLIRDINPNSVTDLKSSHRSVFLLLWPVCFGWRRKSPECENSKALKFVS
jgi:hypothetical protein